MNLSHTEHWLAGAARWWLQSTPFAVALPPVAASREASAADETGPVHVDVAAANRRGLHDRRVRPDVALVQ